MWTVGTALSAAAAAAAVLVVCAPATADAAESEPGLPGIVGATGASVTNDISLDLDRDGVMHAEESLSFGPRPPESFTRTFVVRAPYDTDHERRYDISAVTAEDGEGAKIPVTVDHHERTLTVRLDTDKADKAVLRYKVRGAVATVGQGQELEWAAVGGYSGQVDTTTVQVDAGAPPEALACAAGDPRSSIYCTSSDMGGHEAVVARFTQAALAPGQTLSIVVGYPAGSIDSEPILNRTWSLSSAFAITPKTGGVFGLLLIVLVGGLVVLIRLRSRDERALRHVEALGDSAPLERSDADSGRMRFRPPEDVHPGQIGTLIDEQADVVDLTATVVDLAVRGYLRIKELSHRHFSAVDWELVRTGAGDVRPGDDDVLLEYERLLLAALFRDGDQVRVSQLNSSGSGAEGERARAFTEELAGVRDEMYREMVRLRWFARSPNLERNRWTGTGIVLTLVGVALTVVLAVFTHAAFTGLALIIAGAAVTVGAHYMPAKTKLGSAVFAHTLGFSRFLHTASAEHVPADEGQRVELFSRYLPYAIIFDNVDHWARVLAQGAEDLDRDDLPWYQGPDDWRISDFADSIKMFTLTLSGIISNSRQFKTLR